MVLFGRLRSSDTTMLITKSVKYTDTDTHRHTHTHMEPTNTLQFCTTLVGKGIHSGERKSVIFPQPTHTFVKISNSALKI